MAGARDIRIGVKVDGIDATRQDFKAIGDALNTLGTEGEASAQEISAGFAQIQAASAKVASGIERDGRVSQTALDKLIAEFGRTRDAVDRAFPEGAPDALNTALETAEGRIRSVVAAADNLPTSLEKARNAFRQVESAITETAKAAEPLAHLPIDIGQGFTAAAAAVADFQKKFSETGDVGPGELEKIVKAQERLRIAIERSGKSLDELGPGARQAFDTIDKQAGEATQVVQRLESAVDKNKAALGSMATGWTGLGDAITQSMGRHADVAVQFSIVKAGLDSIRDAIELTEKQMGTAELGGATLSQTFLDLTTSAKDLSVAAQKAGDDILAAGIVFASQPPTVERAKSFVDDYVMSLNKIGVAALAGKEGLTAYQVGLEANLAEQERLNLVYEHGNEVLAFQREAMALGVEGHRVWRTALAESGGTAEGLMGQIERLQPVLKALGDTTDAVTAAADRAAKGWAQYHEKLEETEAAQERAIRATTDAVEKQLEANIAIDGSSKALAHYVDWLAYAAEGNKASANAWEINLKKAQEALDNSIGLTEAEKKRYQGLLDLAGQADKMTDAERQLLKTQLEAALATKEASENTVKWSKSAEESRTSITGLSKDIGGASGGFIQFTEGVKTAAAELDNFMSKADKAAEKLREMQAASAAAAGDDGAGAPPVNVPPPKKTTGGER